MLDGLVRPLIDPQLDRVAVRLAARGISADALTWTGLAIGIASVPAIAAEHYLVGLFFILASRVSDGLDGAVARCTAPTDRGAYLDIVCDFLFYSAVPFAFALARPGNAVAAAFLIFAFVGTGSSFLAFAAIAAKRSITTTARGAKSIYYLGGLTEGTETILAFAIFCLAPEAFPTAAAIFALLCWITTASRIATAMRAFA
ncbi:MAG: CDP-alcohol phosphatidyltransferase family protein [Candidatus Binatia bacterium]